MNFEYLNEMIQYIENHLTEEIDYKKLAKIVGVSEYSLQRIFTFLTNMSIAEYIRKRRLSKAYEELKTSEIKIVDLAIKYQYDSSISFTRAFKSMFGITPSECKDTSKEYKLFPIIKFENNSNVSNELNYKIEDLEEKTIYCYETKASTHEDLLFNIRKLYNELKESGAHQSLNTTGMYGISLHKGNEYCYYVGSEKEEKGTKVIKLPRGKYAIFNVGSRQQKDIVDTLKIIYTQWVQSTNYKIDENFSYEFYKGDNCYLYMLLDTKQN